MSGAAMAAKRKKKRLTKTTLVKAAAREQIGMPPVTRRAPDPTKSDKEKHKPTLSKLLTEEESARRGTSGLQSRRYEESAVHPQQFLDGCLRWRQGHRTSLDKRLLTLN